MTTEKPYPGPRDLTDQEVLHQALEALGDLRRRIDRLEATAVWIPGPEDLGLAPIVAGDSGGRVTIRGETETLWGRPVGEWRSLERVILGRVGPTPEGLDTALVMHLERWDAHFKRMRQRENALAEDVKNLRAQLLAAEERATFAWLVRSTDRPNEYLASVAPNRQLWKPLEDAIRFCRKEDAERVRDGMSLPVSGVAVLMRFPPPAVPR